MKHIYSLLVLGCLILCSSCNNWLDVKPNTREDETETFSSEGGFENALTGVYIQMKQPQLYGKELTMGMIEFMAQHWHANPSGYEGHLSDYDYNYSDVENYINGIYALMYNAIANINNILKHIDNGVLQGDVYKLVKGEALGLRAYLQFDLLRMFGPVPGKQTEDKILTYATNVSKDPLMLNTWEEYNAFLTKDIEDAEKLLNDIDNKSISFDDDYFLYRNNRINYWAVKALEARYLLWIKDKVNAKKVALEIINSKKYDLAMPADFSQNKDFIASKELLFSMHVYDLEDITENFIYRAGGVYQTVDRIKKDLFKNSVTDIRLNNLWKEDVRTSSTVDLLMKYKQGRDVMTNSLQQVPLIRFYEMYLIAIECSGDKNEYLPLVKEIAKARNISGDIEINNEDEKYNYLIGEYNKEFYGEGQMFYVYKRLNRSEIIWYQDEANDDVYVLPLPRTELKYNN